MWCTLIAATWTTDLTQKRQTVWGMGRSSRILSPKKKKGDYPSVRKNSVPDRWGEGKRKATLSNNFEGIREEGKQENRVERFFVDNLRVNKIWDFSQQNLIIFNFINKQSNANVAVKQHE